MDFTYHGVRLKGVDHPYNQTIHNERAVELAVVDHFRSGLIGNLKRQPAGLEVGNVTSHYGLGDPIDRGTVRIVDRYEKAPGVENLDVFDIEGKFDWIISVSTIEHVGWDEDERDAGAAETALEHLQSLILPGGSMLVTVPGGYHPALDESLESGVGATRDCTMVRNEAGGWEQSKTRTFKPYGTTTPWAESIWIGEFDG